MSLDAPAAARPGPFMRPALLLVDMSNANLRLAAQCGATDIVAPCPGFGLSDVQELVDRVSSFGMKVSVIERFVPHDKIVHDLEGRDEQVEDIKRLIRSMGAAGVGVLCYNWMPGNDWTRTSVSVPERGGALVTEFDASKAPVPTSGNAHPNDVVATPREKLWGTLRRFLEEILPVCEEAGVDLALHPDDPPLPELNGRPQIVYSVGEIEKVLDLVPSPRNGICFCQGTFASGGEDVPSAIRRIGTHKSGAIKFVHFRNVVYDGPGRFREAWQDTGDIDNFAAMKAYHDVGFRGVIRPDHVPTLEGEDNSDPGYHVLGRLWALGYIRGLMESIQKG